MLIVQKFGGTSLADMDCLRRAAQRAAQQYRRGHSVVMVVSAQGSTTDALVEKAAPISVSGSRELDAYMATGEQQSAALMAMMLISLGCPAISLTGWQAGLLTDDTFGNAQPLGLQHTRVQRLLESGNIVVVTGFQGVNAGGDITTLGRGGSDTTAVALAAFLGADRCCIYTDVDGVYDRDPRKFPDAVRYDRIDYDTMLTMARNGARVLHDRCVELAKRHGVTVEVLSSFREGGGTVVEKA